MRLNVKFLIYKILPKSIQQYNRYRPNANLPVSELDCYTELVQLLVHNHRDQTK